MDKRVIAIAPIVIDMLNVVKSFRHHDRVYGFFAPAVGIGIRFQRLNFGTLLRKRFAFGISIGLRLFKRLFGVGQHAFGLSLFFLVRRVMLHRQGGEGFTGVGEGALGFFFLALFALNIFGETRGLQSA